MMAKQGYGALCDLILALLPWRIVWNLHMRQRLKIGIALAMSSGVFASACGIAKAIHLIGLSMRSDQTCMSHGSHVTNIYLTVLRRYRFHPPLELQRNHLNCCRRLPTDIPPPHREVCLRFRE